MKSSANTFFSVSLSLTFSLSLSQLRCTIISHIFISIFSRHIFSICEAYCDTISNRYSFVSLLSLHRQQNGEYGFAGRWMGNKREKMFAHFGDFMCDYLQQWYERMCSRYMHYSTRVLSASWNGTFSRTMLTFGCSAVNLSLSVILFFIYRLLFWWRCSIWILCMHALQKLTYAAVGNRNGKNTRVTLA